MKKVLVLLTLILSLLALVSFTGQGLRHKYAKPLAEWPAPWIDEGVKWNELAALPAAPVDISNDSVQHRIR